VARGVDQRPQAAGALDPLIRLAEHARAEPEQEVAAKPDRFAGLDSPRERIEHPQPAALQNRQLAPAHSARDEVALDRLEPRLGRRAAALLELFEPLAPPGEADRSQHRFGRGANDVAHRPVDREQRRERAAIAKRNIGQRQSKVGAEHQPLIIGR
jgi:hypothetical protein